MPTLQLGEHRPTRISAALDGNQLDALRQARVEVRPVGSSGTEWELCPSSWIGVVRCGELNVVIRPRIPMDRVMFLVGYALNPADWRPAPFDLTPDADILEAVIPAFVLRTQEAIRRGLLQGYRTEEASLTSVRGRIRMTGQINERFGLPLPVEAVYDDFTEDIEENRLLKTAIHALWRMPILSPAARRELGALRPAFASVSLGLFRRGMVPEVHYTRLNRRYRPAVELARLIIGGSILELSHGETTGASFLMDMNRVFESFLRAALRDALRLSESEWPTAPPVGRFRIPGGRRLSLDDAAQIPVQPGLTWWRGSRCLFVGDAKYKRLESQQGDIYRMLAYCTAANLPSGLLVYATGEGEPAVHHIPHADKTIEVAAVDLNGSPQAILTEIARIAGRIQACGRAVLSPIPLGGVR